MEGRYLYCDIINMTININSTWHDIHPDTDTRRMDIFFGVNLSSAHFSPPTFLRKSLPQIA